MVTCINALAEDSRVSEIHLFRYPVNKEAPFIFNFNSKVTVYNRKDYSGKDMLELSHEINPRLVLCSGWIDKEYLGICKSFKNKAQTVLTMDNHWEGTIKQNLLRILAPFTLHRYFTLAWVPGKPQRDYALKLGFKSDKIYQGFYVTDTKLFSELFNNFKTRNSIPKVFICVARYIPAKGLEILWEAFNRFKLKNDSEWQLWCVGQGAGFEDRKNYDGIRHLGFIQPNELESVMKQSGIFVLPSLFEPWGVVVQEFASAGFPMLLSNKVGSGQSFLIDGENGYHFKSNSEEDLYKSMEKIASHTEDELKSMAIKSNQLGIKFTIQNWVDTIITIGA